MPCYLLGKSTNNFFTAELFRPFHTDFGLASPISEGCPKYFVSDVHESILAIREIVIYLHLQYSSRCHILNSAISEDTPDR